MSEEKKDIKRLTIEITEENGLVSQSVDRDGFTQLEVIGLLDTLKHKTISEMLLSPKQGEEEK